MKLNKYSRIALIGVIGACLAGSPAQAANTFYDAGDLVLFFQSSASNNTVYVSLNEATGYRGTVAGPSGSPVLNIINLNSTLSSAFGATWQSDATIYAGLAGVRSSTAGSTVTVGDPKRTIYVSQSRGTLGNIYTQGSAGVSIATDTDTFTGAGRIGTMNTPFDNGPDTQATILLKTDPSDAALSSQIDDQNPLLVGGLQGTAFGIFGGGVQQKSTSGNLGAINDALVGDLGTIEFALDLYRILATNNASGQVGGPLRQGTFEGTVVVGSNGMVSFIPEPSSTALLGLAAGAMLMRRRRN